MRIAFLGSDAFAVPSLEAAVAAGHEVTLVVTNPDRPKGRSGAPQPTPVKEAALRLGLPVYQPEGKLGADAAARIGDSGAELGVVVAFGQFLGRRVREAPSRGYSINVHASLLPRWRGAAPINRAVMAGDAASGVMVMRMEEGLDTGPVAMVERTPIGSDMTAGDLHDALAPLGGDLMVRALAALERGSLTLTPQSDDGVTYASKIDKAETRIDWRQPWQAVHNHIRGLSPFPGAWFEMAGEGAPVRVKVLRTTRGEGSGAPGTVLDEALTIACGEGAVRILELQRAGKQPMKADAFLRGTPLARGAMLA